MKTLDFCKAETLITGRKPYHHGDLLKLCVYGYLDQVRSSRRLEKKCHRNLELLWLMKRLTPKTIADFRKDNGRAIRDACRAFADCCGLPRDEQSSRYPRPLRVVRYNQPPYPPDLNA